MDGNPAEQHGHKKVVTAGGRKPEEEITQLPVPIVFFFVSARHMALKRQSAIRDCL